MIEDQTPIIEDESEPESTEESEPAEEPTDDGGETAPTTDA